MKTLPAPSKENEIWIINQLAVLAPTPARLPEFSVKAREIFLNQAAALLDQYPQLAEGKHSATGRRTSSGGLNQVARLIAPLLLVMVILLASAGLALAAAQSSLPGQSLFPLKLWSEDLQLTVTYFSPASWRLALQFSDQRVQEIEALTRLGGVPPDFLLLRLDNQLDQAIAVARTLNSEKAIAAMQALQAGMTAQFSSIEQLEAESTRSVAAEAALAQTREIIQNRLRQVEQWLLDRPLFSLPSPQPSLQVSPGRTPGGFSPNSTPVPGNGAPVTVQPGVCQACPSGSAPSQGTSAPVSNQPTLAGAQSAQPTEGSPQNQTGAPSNGENQPPVPPEDPGQGPGEPQGPGQGGNNGK